MPDNESIDSLGLTSAVVDTVWVEELGDSCGTLSLSRIFSSESFENFPGGLENIVLAGQWLGRIGQMKRVRLVGARVTLEVLLHRPI